MSNLNKRISELEQTKHYRQKSIEEMTDQELYAILRRDNPDFPDVATLSDTELRERIIEAQLQRSERILNGLAELGVIPRDWQALDMDTLEKHISGQKRYVPPLPEDTMKDIFGGDHE